MPAPRTNDRPGPARKVLATLLGIVGTLVWTHALAGALRPALGLAVEDLAPAALALTLAAVATALAGSTLLGMSPRGAAARAAVAGFAAAGAIGRLHPIAFATSLALVPAGVAFALLGGALARRLPAALDEEPARHPRWAAAWVALALLAVVQVGRLATHMTDPESDWFLSTRHPFYAEHECASAYVYAAELSARGEPNVYDARHYPGLDPTAAPETRMVGMTPEDPFQYPPPFLLGPRLAIAATHDYAAIRSFWFGLNVTLCMAAVLALASWVGGRTGTVAGLLSPAVLASFPVLHDFQYGQVHFAAIALAVLGLIALQRERSALGGTLLAVSILAKMFPAVLLVPLAVQKRWRALGWTAGAGAVITAIAWLALGGAPFVAFVRYQLPRLSDGSAFAFGEAWPEVAMLVTAGNQGVQGIVHKLGAMGVGAADASLARSAGTAYALLVLLLAGLAAPRLRGATRAERAAFWLGLVGLGSLASAGAWADYVPLTCVWLLALLLPSAWSRPWLRAALLTCAVMQVSLLGTVPIGEAADARWMMPLSLLSALAMLATFAGAAIGSTAAHRVIEGERRLSPLSAGRLARRDASVL